MMNYIYNYKIHKHHRCIDSSRYNLFISHTLTHAPANQSHVGKRQVWSADLKEQADLENGPLYMRMALPSMIYHRTKMGQLLFHYVWFVCYFSWAYWNGFNFAAVPLTFKPLGLVAVGWSLNLFEPLFLSFIVYFTDGLSMLRGLSILWTMVFFMHGVVTLIHTYKDALLVGKGCVLFLPCGFWIWALSSDALLSSGYRAHVSTSLDA